MAQSVTGEASALLTSVECIKDYLRPQFFEDPEGRRIGIEQEVFVVAQDNSPLIQEEISKLLVGIEEGYQRDDIHVTRTQNSHGHIIRLEVDNLGDITLDSGGQIEIAGLPYDFGTLSGREKTRDVFDDFQRKLQRAASKISAKVWDSAIYERNRESTILPSSRGLIFEEYSVQQGSGNALSNTASTQFTMTAGGKNFHEFAQVGLLASLLLGIGNSSSKRMQYIYGKKNPAPFAANMAPPLNVWGVTNFEEALAAIVDHYRPIVVPVLPDTGSGSEYVRTYQPYQKAPTTDDLMVKGQLTDTVYENIRKMCWGPIGLIRGFRSGCGTLMEVRTSDCLKSTSDIIDTATILHGAILLDRGRRNILDAHRHLTPDDMGDIHHALSTMDRSDALKMRVGNRHETIEGLIAQFREIAQSALDAANKNHFVDARQETTAHKTDALLITTPPPRPLLQSEHDFVHLIPAPEEGVVLRL